MPFCFPGVSKLNAWNALLNLLNHLLEKAALDDQFKRAAKNTERSGKKQAKNWNTLVYLNNV